MDEVLADLPRVQDVDCQELGLFFPSGSQDEEGEESEAETGEEDAANYDKNSSFDEKDSGPFLL